MSPIMYGKPPVALSPRRLRSRRSIKPLSNSIQTPPASTRIMPKSKIPTRKSLPVSYDKLISSELLEMAKALDSENMDFDPNNSVATPMFERGRFYELYSAKRNQRLMKKKIDLEYDEIVGQDPGVAIELSKIRNLKKGQESSVRKSMPNGYRAGVKGSSLRSSLRSSKEIKNGSGNLGGARKTVAALNSGRRTGTRSDGEVQASSLSEKIAFSNEFLQTIRVDESSEICISRKRMLPEILSSLLRV